MAGPLRFAAMTIGERIDQNMQTLAAQSIGQLVATTLAVMVGLGLMVVLGVAHVEALIGGTIGFLAVNLYARHRHPDEAP